MFPLIKNTDGYIAICVFYNDTFITVIVFNLGMDLPLAFLLILLASRYQCGK